jgi:transcriptional regulator with XRE-family HTH domain
MFHEAGVGALVVGYLIGYHRSMDATVILEKARQAAGLSQAALAAASGTSRPTLSAYEHGRKSPTLQTAARILAAAGYELTITPLLEFREVAVDRGRPIAVPTALPRLPVERALAAVELPLHLNWSDRGRRFDLRDRRQRARVYEIVLREGRPDDVLAYIDGVLLLDLWEDLVLPRQIRAAWQSIIAEASEARVA